MENGWLTIVFLILHMLESRCKDYQKGDVLEKSMVPPILGGWLVYVDLKTSYVNRGEQLHSRTFTVSSSFSNIPYCPAFYQLIQTPVLRTRIRIKYIGRIRSRIYIKVMSWIRIQIRIRINFRMTSQKMYGICAYLSTFSRF